MYVCFLRKFFISPMLDWWCLCVLQTDSKPRQHAFVTQDMASFMCLICEMFLAPRLRMQEVAPSLVKRLQNVKALCAGDISMIPR